MLVAFKGAAMSLSTITMFVRMGGLSLCCSTHHRRIGTHGVAGADLQRSRKCGNCFTTVPKSRDIPPGTARAIEADLAPCLGDSWLESEQP